MNDEPFQLPDMVNGAPHKLRNSRNEVATTLKVVYRAENLRQVDPVV